MERVNPYLNNFAFYLLMLMALTLILSNALAVTLAGAVCVIWILQTVAYRRSSYLEYPLFKLLCAFIGYKLLVLLIAGYENGLGRALGQVAFPLLYLVVPTVVVTAERRRNILWLIITGAIIASGYGLIKYHIGLETRISSFVSGYYTMGTYVCLVIGILLVMFAHADSGKERVFLGLVMIPLVAALIFTYVRAGYLALIAAVTMVGLMKDRRVLAVLTIIVLALLFIIPGTGAKIMQRLDFSAPGALSERDILWSEGLLKAKTVPFFGYGINSFPALFDVQNDARIKDKSISTWHNMYLEALLDGGPLSLIFLVAVFLFQGRHSLAIYRRTRDPNKKMIHMVVMVLLVIVAVIGLFADVLRDPIISLLIWLILGLSII